MSEQLKPLPKPPAFQNPTFLKPGTNRKPILPTYRSPKKKKTCTCRMCCCITFLTIMILILIIGVLGCLFYLFLQPKVPVFHLQSVRFNKFNVTDTSDVPVLNSEAIVSILVRNKNSILATSYGETSVELKGDDVSLGTGNVPAFSQEKKNTTVLKLTTKLKDILEPGSVKKVKDGFKSKKLMMGTVVNTKVGVGANGWNSIKVPVKVTCDGVSLKELQSGSSVPECKITVLKVFKLST